MTQTGRRLAERHALRRPVEARLLLCRAETVGGWVLDEQDDGLGMVFGSRDVARLEEHIECCVGGPIDLFMGGGQGGRPIPVCLAHISPATDKQECRAGLAFDVSRMRSEDVGRLLTMWRQLATSEHAEP